MPSSPTARCSPCFIPPRAPAGFGVGDRGEVVYRPAPPPPPGLRVIAHIHPPATRLTWLWGESRTV